MQENVFLSSHCVRVWFSVDNSIYESSFSSINVFVLRNIYNREGELSSLLLAGN